MFDRRRTIDELEALTGVSWSSYQRILTEELHFSECWGGEGKTKEALKVITLQELQNCFEEGKKRWDKCIDSEGEYFEGD